MRLFNPTGEWITESTGVGPDVEVDMDPGSARDGHDPQLERRTSIALEQLGKKPPPNPDDQHPLKGDRVRP